MRSHIYDENILMRTYSEMFSSLNLPKRMFQLLIQLSGFRPPSIEFICAKETFAMQQKPKRTGPKTQE